MLKRVRHSQISWLLRIFGILVLVGGEFLPVYPTEFPFLRIYTNTVQLAGAAIIFLPEIVKFYLSKIRRI